MGIDKLRAIAYFVRTVEAGSFAAAARSLDVSASALSKALTALEEELGFTLFNRSTRKLSLTDDGAAYQVSCREVLQRLEDAELAGRRSVATVRGTLRVGVHPALRASLLEQLHRFLAEYTELKLEMLTTNAPSAVLDLGLDVVLHIGRLDDSALVALPLGWADFVVCASAGYLEAHGVPQHPDDLARHDAIVYARPDEDPRTRWEFTRDGVRHVAALRIRLVMRDGLGAITAAIHDCGLARPYEVAVRRALKSGELLAVLGDWSGDRQPVHAVFPKSNHVPAKVRAFVEFARSLV
jgi:DNA-binding transcriptional LysR family regulator